MMSARKQFVIATTEVSILLPAHDTSTAFAMRIERTPESMELIHFFVTVHNWRKISQHLLEEDVFQAGMKVLQQL